MVASTGTKRKQIPAYFSDEDKNANHLETAKRSR